MSKFVVRAIESQHVDPETGEVLQYTDRTEVVRTDSEPFFLTYSKQIVALCGKPIFNATSKVLWKLLEFAEYNTGKVYMNSGRKQEILKECSISRATYDRAIRDLVDAEIIEKNKDTYTINEGMFWKGDQKARMELMEAKLKVTFTPTIKEKVTVKTMGRKRKTTE